MIKTFSKQFIKHFFSSFLFHDLIFASNIKLSDFNFSTGTQMAHVYAHLFGVPCTGLRFFSVYGPWGRPDMAPFKFVHSILSGKPITVYGDGKQTRDWTFIDDVVEGVVRALDQPATAGMQFKYSSTTSMRYNRHPK